MDFVRSRLKSFQYAFEGWHYVLRTQPNAWIHAVFSLLVIALALLLRLPPRDWAVLILTILVVWMAEFINTALEAVVDMAMPELHPLAKAAKDVAAAAVLLGIILRGSILTAIQISALMFAVIIVWSFHRAKEERP